MLNNVSFDNTNYSYLSNSNNSNNSNNGSIGSSARNKTGNNSHVVKTIAWMKWNDDFDPTIQRSEDYVEDKWNEEAITQ